MNEEYNVVTCNECARFLTEEEKRDPKWVCPECGSKIPDSHSILRTSINLAVDVSVKVKDPSGFVTQEERSKTQIYEKTGEPVNNSYSVDRTNPHVTINHHKIVTKGIIPRIIHEHVDVSPAKHRPKKDE